MLDSSSSGTSTRSVIMHGKQMGELKLFSNFYRFKENSLIKTLNKNNQKSEGNFIEGSKHSITLAAARDFEEAQATEKGSLFTLGFYQALEKAAQINYSITLHQLINQSSDFISDKLSHDLGLAHHPIVFADKDLAQQPLILRASRNGQGPNWQDLKRLSKLSNSISVSSNKKIFKIGDRISFKLDIPVDGYLNIINVDAHDESTVIFPNKFNQDNFTSVGKFNFPNENIEFDIVATKPYGDSLTVFLITAKPLNLYKQGLNIRDNDGKLINVFAQLNQYSMRSMNIIALDDNSVSFIGAITTTLE